eukprot:scaffold215083_cov30-Prasinocladus_malaysianus.AAC.1
MQTFSKLGTRIFFSVTWLFLRHCRYYNQTAEPELRLGLLEEGCLVLGFASYKLGLAIEIWESLKPKPKTREELMRQERPMLPQLEDIDDIRPDLRNNRFK